MIVGSPALVIDSAVAIIILLLNRISHMVRKHERLDS
jgi:hypothetical protein